MTKYLVCGICAIALVFVFAIACDTAEETVVVPTPVVEPVAPVTDEAPVVELSETDTTDSDAPVVE